MTELTSLTAKTPRVRPTQAVILAGGEGGRLRPLTATYPKPMVDINGKPFLEHLLLMLREQGFERVLLLLGYLPEIVVDYFGDGSDRGLKIDYSASPVENNTGRRLKLAESRLDEIFLLMYCDNYWPMPFDRMWERYLSLGAPALLTVYSNKDGYTKDSIRVDEHGYITAYDKRNGTKDVKGVEISYGIFNRSVVSLLGDDNISLEEVLYPNLIAKRQLAAFVTDHRYYSVGGPQRLPLTETFLARRPAIILDRDGVLNRRPPKASYVRTWSEFEWLPGATEALRMLKAAGYRIVVVSNQAGIARGAMTEADLLEIHRRMQRDAVRAGGGIDAFYYCPHHWDAGCECRKPKPGMLFEAQRGFNLDLTRTLFIGDDERDGQAAQAAGCLYVMIEKNNSLFEVVRKLLSGSLRSKSKV